jgi:hypothetical protein
MAPIAEVTETIVKALSGSAAGRPGSVPQKSERVGH